MQQLPLEGKRFSTVDRSWRKTLDAAKRAPGVLKVLATAWLCCFGGAGTGLLMRRKLTCNLCVLFVCFLICVCAHFTGVCQSEAAGPVC